MYKLVLLPLVNKSMQIKVDFSLSFYLVVTTFTRDARDKWFSGLLIKVSPVFHAVCRAT